MELLNIIFTKNNYKILKETKKALLIKIERFEFWVPKSILGKSYLKKFDKEKYALILPNWFYEQSIYKKLMEEI